MFFGKNQFRLHESYTIPQILSEATSQFGGLGADIKDWIQALEIYENLVDIGQQRDISDNTLPLLACPKLRSVRITFRHDCTSLKHLSGRLRLFSTAYQRLHQYIGGGLAFVIPMRYECNGRRCDSDDNAWHAELAWTGDWVDLDRELAKCEAWNAGPWFHANGCRWCTELGFRTPGLLPCSATQYGGSGMLRIQGPKSKDHMNEYANCTTHAGKRTRDSVWRCL